MFHNFFLFLWRPRYLSSFSQLSTFSPWFAGSAESTHIWLYLKVPERRATAEHFYCGSTHPLLIKPEKPIQTSLLISVNIYSHKMLTAPILLKANCLFVCLFVWFYGISPFVGYLMWNPFLYKWTILFQTVHFSMSTQFNCQKHFYFMLFSLIKRF